MEIEVEREVEWSEEGKGEKKGGGVKKMQERKGRKDEKRVGEGIKKGDREK